MRTVTYCGQFLKNMEGKIALITGGAVGIGFAYADELLKNGSKGVSLIDIDKDKGQLAAEKLNEKYGKGKAIFVCTDVTIEEQFKEAFESTIKNFKQLDIVINNAGIIQEREWRKCLKLNLEGLINGTQLAVEQYLPKYKSGDEGILVNTSSLAAFFPIAACPVYTATKAGIVGLSRAYGTETFYKKFKVRVLTICPGATNTNIISAPPESYIPEIFMGEYRDHLNFSGQDAECVGRCLITAIKEGKNGSVWGSEMDDPCYDIRLPEKNSDLHKHL